jgi:hypothetical protein
MRKALALLSAFSVGVAGVIPVSVFAQQGAAAAPVAAAARPIDPVVLAAFKAYPAGGPLLTDRIRLLLLQNNYLANDVARAVTTNGLLNPRQRAAGEQGLAEALSRLGVTGQLQPPAPASPPDLDPGGSLAGTNGLVNQVPPAATDAGLSDAQWAALVAGLAIGGGALGFGIYETTKKTTAQVTKPVSPN